jgi:transposase
MEATGVYWKPVWAVLEDTLELTLVNARHVKAVPGHKTDIKDAQVTARAWQIQQRLLVRRLSGSDRGLLR